jgi:hypothetical protein
MPTIRDMRRQNRCGLLFPAPGGDMGHHGPTPGPASDTVLLNVEDSMRAADIPVSVELRAGVLRLDAAVDLATNSRAEGLSILNGVAALAPTGCRAVPWRAGRRVG